MAVAAFQEITNVQCKHVKLTVHHPGYRQKLIRWLFEVCVDLEYSPCTFATAVALVDTYSERVGHCASEYQLAGTAALLVAAKIEERTTHRVATYAQVTDNSCSAAAIVTMERAILETADGLPTLPYAHYSPADLAHLPGTAAERLQMLHCAVAALLERRPGQQPLGLYRAACEAVAAYLGGAAAGEALRFYIDKARIGTIGAHVIERTKL